MRCFTFLWLLLATTAKAQTIQGSVRNEQGEPLVNATITAYRDSAVWKYTLSDNKGTFQLAQPAAGKLRLYVSYKGYQDWDSILTMPVAIAIQVNMQRMAQSLSAVTVNSNKPLIEVQPDKTVFNVSGSIVGSGGSALEVLQKSPGVLVDKDDNITMNAKSGVRIYIDGRPSPLSVQEIAAQLRTMPAADIDAIEIITNPSARYEAAGNAGIINIRLKKNKNYGTNGSINTGWNLGLFPKYNSGVSLNHRNKKINLFSNYSYNKGRYQSTLNLFRYQNDSLFDQRSQTNSRSKSHNIKAGADFFINKQQTLGVLVNTNLSDNSGRTRSLTPIAAQDDKLVVQTLEAITQSERRRTNISANINYRFADTAGSALTADADYGYYDMEASAFTPNYYRNNAGAILYQTTFGNRTPVRIRFYSLQASWEQNWKGGKLNVGWRSTWASTNNTFHFFDYINNAPVLSEERSNRFNYNENINAAYLQYSKQKGAWSYQAGLRLEHTASLGELIASQSNKDQRVQRNYINLFPTSGITYQLNKNHQLGLSLGRRIDRPSYQDLNPFENRIDELTYQKGNPFLRPQFTNNIELKHTYKYKLSSSIGFSDVQDFFAAITDTIEGRRNFITTRNLASQKIWSLNTGMPFAIAKWWNLYFNAGVNHSRYRAQFEPGKEVRINATVANIYQQHSFTFSKKWSGELSCFYMSPYVWAGNYECRSMWSLDAGVQTKLLRDKATLKLSISDIFRRMPWEGTSRLGQLRIDASGGWESRQLRLNFAYRFGNKEVKAARQRKTGLDDLNNRVQ
ncbi:Outer membrane receptor proteins, mostly Fe transport [Cnuella takakiae]|uniref:Outer membrane receptor proteins, mostly Fe transport n=1 Tax=Cnuella takakiae TaxID=1302690 RepID=A0A1M5GSV4_9BACT|nr:TonB-dependent receptor [Cnuella takakiae]OLY90904.1 hypothetical protein BUE76_02580 [Cnuella takakiae]SHG06697.1 Outer membrane receptor proteins, mostly Fe transport [Cnuella takakiae]